MAKETIKIPDLGGGDDVEVIEICVAVGDVVAEEDSLLVLESDKASMEVPSPKSGKVVSISVSVGDTVAEGAAILELETEAEEQSAASAEKTTPAETKDEAAPEPEQSNNTGDTDSAAQSSPASSSAPRVETASVPDIGGGSVEVIEVCVSEGDEVAEGDSLVVLESDKASMEVPAPFAGRVRKLLITVGATAEQGTALAEIETDAADSHDAESEPANSDSASAPSAPAPATQKAETPEVAADTTEPTVVSHADVYAGPAVRKLAREFGITLEDVKGTGPKDRILKEDLHAYVKQLAAAKPASGSVSSGSGIPPIPDVDFSQFGDIDTQPLSKMAKLTAANMHRSWVNLPHVTQFDEVDISDLEDFRAQMKKEAEQRGVKLTPLPFLLKAAAAALRANPRFNASLTSDGESIVYKQYVHIGIAVDTPAGLVVPVIRDVDKKSLWTLAEESAELAAKAKERKLKPADMQGGCFTISSLGNIGGTGFTPIINAPEVAIMGVSKLAVKPQWNGSEFVPRKMLPVSLSYDHRAINGADAGQFFTFLGRMLADIRQLLL
ncbi:dihydrolipoyllysine-residue acetyltransferase [Spongiibacter sp. KMU-166]|uniref:Acetyltransferase component of pyruvate dehydrogenase complex n=1 Tax=Spongiibacter thalassae TaxID=2721624 RepID=A0ABX1GFN9_9GAMM|nr:dihydrolipoyllysine-residue acetyltransferase [Spongiibacter thalassae]